MTMKVYFTPETETDNTAFLEEMKTAVGRENRIVNQAVSIADHIISKSPKLFWKKNTLIDIVKHLNPKITIKKYEAVAPGKYLIVFRVHPEGSENLVYAHIQALRHSANFTLDAMFSWAETQNTKKIKGKWEFPDEYERVIEKNDEFLSKIRPDNLRVSRNVKYSFKQVRQ